MRFITLFFSSSFCREGERDRERERERERKREREGPGPLRCVIMPMSGILWQFNETVARGWSTFRYFSHQRSSRYTARPRSRAPVAPGKEGRCLGWTWQRRSGVRGTYFSWNLSRLSAQRDLPSCIILSWRSCKSRLFYLVPSSRSLPAPRRSWRLI